MKKLLSILLMLSISIAFAKKDDLDLIILKDLKKNKIDVENISLSKQKILHVTINSDEPSNAIECTFDIINKYAKKLNIITIVCYNDFTRKQYEVVYKKNKLNKFYKAISSEFD